MKIALILSFALAVYGLPATENGKRLIKTSHEEPAEWMSQAEIWNLIEKHANFIDLTDHDLKEYASKSVSAKGTKIASFFTLQKLKL